MDPRTQKRYSHHDHLRGLDHERAGLLAPELAFWAVFGNMFRFSAPQRKSLTKAFQPFLLGELSQLYISKVHRSWSRLPFRMGVATSRLRCSVSVKWQIESLSRLHEGLDLLEVFESKWLTNMRLETSSVFIRHLVLGDP